MIEYGLDWGETAPQLLKIIHERLADYTYELCPSTEELAPFLTEKKFKAINVTIPYKRDVIPFL